MYCRVLDLVFKVPLYGRELHTATDEFALVRCVTPIHSTPPPEYMGVTTVPDTALRD